MEKFFNKDSPVRKNGPKTAGTTVIDIYQKMDDDVLGRGGMAVVYLGGYAPDAGDPTVMFAIKQMQIKEKIEQSGLDEINLLRKLVHPNIVRFIDARKQENSMYLILQYCDEGTLEKYIKENRDRMSEESILKLFAQIVLAMRFLQSKNIIHRDIKPKNILLHEGTVKIADFGVAKMIDKYKQNITFEGTIAFMSPQMLKQENYTSLTDMWSLGVTLFYMIFKKLPYEQPNPSKLLNEIIKRGNQQSLVPKQNISEDLRKLLEKMLQIREENRLSWNQLYNHHLLKKYIEEYEKEEALLEDSNVETQQITLEQFWKINAPKLDQVQKRGKELSKLYRESKLKIDLGIEAYKKISLHKERCRFLKRILTDMKEYRKQQIIEQKKQLFLKCHFLLAKRSFILSQDLNHIVFLKSNSQGIICIPKNQFDEFMKLPKYNTKLNQLRNAAEDLRKYNLNEWHDISKEFMKVYRSELRLRQYERANDYINQDMMQTPKLIQIFTRCFLQLFIYLSRPIVKTYSHALYQQIQKSKFLAQFHVDIMFLYDLIVLMCFHNLGQNPNFEAYYERRNFASIQEIVYRIITAYDKWEPLLM